MDVSIIIINYKTPNLVIECVESVRKLTKNLNYEIIVIDNGSNDDSSQIIKEKLDNKITLIISEINLGFGKANNLGTQYANGKYLFFLNSDTLLINNAVKELFDFLEENENVGIVGGNLYSKELNPNPSHSLVFDSIENKIKESTWKWLFSQIIKRKLKKNSKQFSKEFNYSNEPIDVAYVYGADMMIKKELFRKINGFDKDFFMYYEEQELSYRVKKLGYKIKNLPNAKIIHYDGISIKKEKEFSEKQYRMRLNGAFIYFYKLYGINGMGLLYKYKLKRINHEITKAFILNKKSIIQLLNIQKECLIAEYEVVKGEYINGGDK